MADGFRGVFGATVFSEAPHSISIFGARTPPPWEAGATGPPAMRRPLPASRGPQYGPLFETFPGPSAWPPGRLRPVPADDPLAGAPPPSPSPAPPSAPAPPPIGPVVALGAAGWLLWALIRRRR